MPETQRNLLSLRFKTNRLTVEHLTPNAQLHQNLKDLLTPAVTKHLPPGYALGPGPDAPTRWLAARHTEDAHIFTARTSGTLAGLLLLHEDTQASHKTLRLGYLLAESQWGQGLASELINGLVRWCRGNYRPCELIGGVEPDNPASARVLLKAGFAADPSEDNNAAHMYHLRLP